MRLIAEYEWTFAYLFSTVAASSLVDLCRTWPEENTGEKLIAPAVNITFT